jgi:hypothetical protein
MCSSITRDTGDRASMPRIGYRRYAISKDDQLRAGLAKLRAHLAPAQCTPQSAEDAPESTKGNVGGIPPLHVVGND